MLAHKIRNVANYLPKKEQKECVNQARNIYQAKNKKQAVSIYKEWAGQWEEKRPKAVNCIRKDLNTLLNFLDCPKDHRIKIRTTFYQKKDHSGR